MKKPKPLPDDAPPPPPCSSCGAPAGHEVVLETRPLVLEREAGVRSEPYWKGSYHGSSSRIVTNLCDGCLKSQVRVEFAVHATLEKAQKSP